MLLINELKRLRHSFLNNSSLSLKEKAFYQFLVDNPLDYPTENNLAEIEQICLSVFGKNFLSKKDLVAAQRKKQPIRGMHYTTNLIELSAMAIDNIKLERENLRLYCKKCSTRDFYILSHLFPEISSNLPQPKSAIDQLALHLHESNFPQEGWKPLLLRGLYEASDLIDFYIIEQGYQQAMDDNPIVHRVKDITYIRNTFVRFIQKTEHQVKFTIVVVGIVVLFFFLYWLAPIIVRNWEASEPIIAIRDILFPLLIALLAFAGYAPDKMRFFNLPREKIIDRIFRWNNLNRQKLKKTLDRLK